MFGANSDPLRIPWVIYAIGQGESALERAVTLANLAAKHRQIIILTNAVSSSSVRDRLSQDCSLNNQVSIQCAPGSNSDEAKEESVLQLNQLCSVAPFVLVVDALPNGFYQELADILPRLTTIPKVLVLRELSAEYAIAHDIHNLIETHYDLAIAPGAYETPTAFSLPNAVQTLPWIGQSLLASDARRTARTSLGINDENLSPTVLVLSSEGPGERSTYGYLCATLAQQCPQINVRCFSRLPLSNCPLDLWCNHWPATDYLPAADLVIGAGDYATVYACQRLGIPLIAFPWTRRDDLQRKRIDRAASERKSPVETVTSAEGALSCVFEFLNRVIADDSSKHRMFNTQVLEEIQHHAAGVQTAVELIEKTVASKWNQAAQMTMEHEIAQLRLVRTDSQEELW